MGRTLLFLPPAPAPLLIQSLMLKDRYRRFSFLEAELTFPHVWPGHFLTMRYNLILTIPVPSWATGLVGHVGRKRFSFLIKSHIQKLLHLKTTKTSAQPAKGQGNSPEVLCFPPCAECPGLCGVRLNLVRY